MAEAPPQPAGLHGSPDSLKILWIKSGNGVFHPLDSGGKIRTHAMLREINRDHRVSYLALRRPDNVVGEREWEDPYATDKEWVVWNEAAKGSARFFLELIQNAFFSNLPYSLAKYQSSKLRNRIRERLQNENFDLVVCDFLYAGLNVAGLDARVPTILFQHNIEAQIWERMAKNKRNPISRFYFGRQHKRMRRWEQKLSAQFDGVITVSPEDTAIARVAYGLTNVLGHVPAGVDFDFFSPGSPEGGDPEKIAFLGSMDWMPNIEAVLYFHREIFPLLLGSRPGLKLVVIGRNPAQPILDLAEDDPAVEVSGSVPDVRDWVNRCAVMVVPLLSGGGTRIKILEAMAMGIPVVSTTVGAEGLDLEPGRHLLIGDGTDDFAAQTARLLDDASLRESLARESRDHVVEERGWNRAATAFIDLCRKISPENPTAPDGGDPA